MMVQIFNILILLCFVFSSRSFAVIEVLQVNPGIEVVSETVPYSFPPNNFSASDFQVNWVPALPPEVKADLADGSLQWIRVHQVMVLPRAELQIKSLGESVRSATLSQYGHYQSIANSGGGFPIALLEGKSHQIELKVLYKDGAEKVYRGQAKFASINLSLSNRVLFDLSCSPYSFKVSQSTLSADSWLYVGCQMIWNSTEGRGRSSLKLWMVWNKAERELLLDGQKIESAGVPSVFLVQLNHAPGRIRISKTNDGSKPESEPESLDVSYKVPDQLKRLNVALGIGPYFYEYQKGSNYSVKGTFVPLITLYASVFIRESMRLVMFNATPIHSARFNDLGLYFSTEQIRGLDERVSLNLLLGAHILYYQSATGSHWKLSAPQGFEVVARDILKKRYNLGTGSFLYPDIGGRSYYNLWLRYGTSGLFGEINYISWQETFGGSTTKSKSLGLTFGFPIGSFL